MMLAARDRNERRLQEKLELQQKRQEQLEKQRERNRGLRLMNIERRQATL